MRYPATHKASTRRRIVDWASAALRARGVAGVGVADLMRQAGLTADIDAIANVVGRHAADDPHAPALILASHYDTVRNAGKYDGRLGVLVALVVAEHLRRLGRKLPFHLDVIAFSEE